MTRLTATEARLAGLVAGGRTDGEVAAELRLTPSEFAQHMAIVFRKLEVRSRTELALLLGGASAGEVRDEPRR